MTILPLAPILAISLLSESPEVAEPPSTAETAAPRTEMTFAPTTNAAISARSIKISSDRADYDRKSGVILFNQNVVAEDPDCNLHAEKMYVFLDGVNQLTRIVVTGNVAITNGTKSGTCERAVYLKQQGKVMMFGSKDSEAQLVNDEGRRSVVNGSTITFWTNSEQVEVDRPTILLEGGVPAASTPTQN